MEKEKLLRDDCVKKGELCVVAGVKDIGKSTLLQNIADVFQRDDSGKQVLFFYASKRREVSTKHEDRVKYIELTELPLQTGHILLEAGWVQKDYGLSAIIIDDYRYLLRTEMFRGKELSRSEKILFLLTRFKTLAEAYDVPMIVSSNVDDDYIWGRHEKKPLLSDIPDYEYVEMLADKLILLHRDEVFDKESEKKGLAELAIYDLATRNYRDYQLAYLQDKNRFCCLER